MSNGVRHLALDDIEWFVISEHAIHRAGDFVCRRHDRFLRAMHRTHAAKERAIRRFGSTDRLRR